MRNITEQQVADRLGSHDPAPDTIMPAVLVRTGLADEFVPLQGPIGPLYVAFTPYGVSAIVPTIDEEQFLTVHQRTVGRPAYPGDRLPKRLDGPLRRALASGRLGSLPVDLRPLTDFQREVLATTARIPPGEVRTYGWVAREIGRGRAVRAVGSALGRNPVPIVIPCHRVVPSGGGVGNYAFGPAMKVALLHHEGVTDDELGGGASRYVGSDGTKVFCFPTCRAARRIGARHRVEFATVVRAMAAGYRPCKVCRPG